MLHEGARTRFILSGLTRAVELLFSIRQGDPLAMILYIIYIEPLLRALERRMSGMKIANFIEQKLEAYCDDINITTDNLGDFDVVESVVKKFEMVSGAILSRDKKCKVIGLGNWASKKDWPLVWIKAVKHEKIFGVFVSDSYDEMLKLNWDHRYKKFSNVLYSWSHRVLDTLQQRVEVIKMFGLSRVYYVAAILPINAAMVKKFETLMGKFIWNWSGKILRVAIDEIKNKKLEGGLQLPCLSTMADALIFSQCIRLIKSEDSKSLQHLKFWIGDSVEAVMKGSGSAVLPGTGSAMLAGTGIAVLPGTGSAVLPGTGSAGLPWSGGRVTAAGFPEYFKHVAGIFEDMLTSEVVTDKSIRSITNKAVYADMTSSLPPPKVVMEGDKDYSVVWGRLHSPVVDYRARDVMYLLLHNKLPVQERLFRIRLRADPYCLYCVGAEIGDAVHFFCTCRKVSDTWSWVKRQVITQVGRDTADWDVINMFFPKSRHDKEIVWMLTHYVLYVWENVHVKESDVKLDQFIGYLKFKYKESQIKLNDLQIFI